jgi:hypothetical protein
VLQVGVHHGDHLTLGNLKTSADSSSQTTLARTSATVHKVDPGVGKHRLADRVGRRVI